MDPIRKSISDVHYSIPKAILQRTFIDRYNPLRTMGVGLDAQIENLVIRPRVCFDCNLVGGILVMIPLEGLPQQDVDNTTCIIRIPKERTQGKSIVSALTVNYTNSAQLMGYNGYGMAGAGMRYTHTENTAMNGLMQTLVSSQDKIPVTSTSNVKLVAENTIAITDGMRVTQAGWLVCMLANDENMANINPRSYHHFSQLVVWAVKAYIYNELIVELDMGQLEGGFQLGVIKTIIEGYSDAEQGYQDYLRDKWTKVAFMNDENQYRRYIRTVLGGAH